MVGTFVGQEGWSDWSLNVAIGQSCQWIKRMVSVVSEQKQWTVWSLDTNIGQSGQWTEKVFKCIFIIDV